MKRRRSTFLLTLTAVLALVYLYLALRLTEHWGTRLALFLPFALAWALPALYWQGRREAQSRLDDAVHLAGYLGMAAVNFLLVFSLLRDLVLLIGLVWPGTPAGWVERLRAQGGPWVWLASGTVLLLGFLTASLGPRVRRVDLPLPGLAPALDGLRIVQISDLHVGSTLGIRYVRRVVALTRRLQPDLVALTGDIIDGPVERLAPAVAPLAQLAPPGRSFLVLGNHEYYADPQAWVQHFSTLGIEVLLNRHTALQIGDARLLLGGVTDPISDRPFGPPQPQRAAGLGEAADLRILLAHHPKLAGMAATAGFDLQLSGHTHGGQFFPWTLVVRWIHAPHAAGLSRQGAMLVYVSTGTGSWGPPIRFGTQPELTLLTLRRAPAGTPSPAPGSKP